MSARYKISNRNIYGFRTNMYQMMFLLIPLLIALSLLAEFVLGPVLYGFYQKDATLEEGAAGTQAGADVQVAESIADMERLDTFTIITKGAVVNYDTVRSGDQVYHRLHLPSGELVIAHINKKAIQETEEAGVYRLPIGVWIAWEPPAEVLVYEELLAAPDHYVDMYGEYVPVLSQADYGMALGRLASVWLFVIAIVLYRVLEARSPAAQKRHGALVRLHLRHLGPLLFHAGGLAFSDGRPREPEDGGEFPQDVPGGAMGHP